MNSLPEAISTYLASLDGKQFTVGYICVDAEHRVTQSNGWVGPIDLRQIEKNQSPVLTLPLLEGLLPEQCGSPTVIKHVHIDKETYFDIHTFYANDTGYIVFFDKTRSAKKLQAEQQFRLDDDFKEENKRQGNG